METPRIVITAHETNNIKELKKLHKSITLWRTKRGGARPVSLLEWAKQAHSALSKGGVDN